MDAQEIAIVMRMTGIAETVKVNVEEKGNVNASARVPENVKESPAVAVTMIGAPENGNVPESVKENQTVVVTMTEEAYSPALPGMTTACARTNKIR